MADRVHVDHSGILQSLRTIYQNPFGSQFQIYIKIRFVATFIDLFLRTTDLLKITKLLKILQHTKMMKHKKLEHEAFFKTQGPFITPMYRWPRTNISAVLVIAIPGIIVGLTAGLTYDSYTDEDYCLLRHSNNNNIPVMYYSFHLPIGWLIRIQLGMGPCWDDMLLLNIAKIWAQSHGQYSSIT